MATRLLERLRAELCARVAQGAAAPVLAVVMAGADPASDVYVRRKLAACRTVGIGSQEHRLPDDIAQDALVGLIDRLNADGKISGILVQLPLPPHIDPLAVLDRIAPNKDVDGFHPVNVGRLSIGAERGLIPCTPMGCMMLLDSVVADYRGLDAVVIGKSNIVGKPVGLLLLERGCTVTMTHIDTRGLSAIVRKADIVVAAAGAPGLVRGDWIKQGSIVIDVGITRVENPDGTRRIVGDCRAAEMPHAAAVTPVPGGVGPMTVACLMANTMRARFPDLSIQARPGFLD